MRLRTAAWLCLPVAAVLSGCGGPSSNCDGGVCPDAGHHDGGCLGLTDCGAVCSNLATDPQNCGACGHVCSLPHATAGCAQDSCTIASCDPGFLDADGNPANGCESSCQGMSISSSGSLNFDLKTVSISGAVTLDGQAAPAGNPRGTLTFALAGADSSVSVGISTVGAASYQVQLFAGVYTITYSKAADCGAGKMPCDTQILKQGMTLSASGSLDLDVLSQPASGGDGGTVVGNPITVSGEVTVNGAQMAASPVGQLRGQILFYGQGGGTPVSAPLGTSGPATYSVTLAPGTYDVAIDGKSTCSTQGPLPCELYVRMKAVAIATSGSLNVDLPVVSLSGNVTVNGAQMANSTTGLSRGVLGITNDSGGVSVDLGVSGPASYQALLYAGTYQLSVTNSSGCTGPLPCQSQLAASGVQVTANGAYDVDVKVVSITGQVTVNGQSMGASPRGVSRGQLVFSRSNGDQNAVDLGVSGPATYQVLLYADSYDAVVDNSSDCPDGPVPCGTATLQHAVPLTASGAYDLDIPAAQVAGAVTVNQAAMPQSPSGSSRGTVTFKGPSTVSTDIPGSGSANFTVTLYPGTYAISFANQSDCPAGPAPCQTYPVQSALSISGPSSLPIDLPVGDVSGTVTANGADLASSASGGSRGTLTFAEPKLGQVSADLGTSGPATFHVRLFPSTYQVLVSNGSDCPFAGQSPLPCQGDTQVSAALSVPAGAASANFDVKVLTVSGVVTVNGAQMPDSPNGNIRGFLSFGIEPKSTPVRVSLGSSGAATFQTNLMQGVYDIGFTNSTDCPNGAVPCESEILDGCRVP